METGPLTADECAQVEQMFASPLVRVPLTIYGYNFHGGWRYVKLLTSGETRRVRDACIFRINDMEVFL